jgi:hypothetical protein
MQQCGSGHSPAGRHLDRGFRCRDKSRVPKIRLARNMLTPHLGQLIQLRMGGAVDLPRANSMTLSHAGHRLSPTAFSHTRAPESEYGLGPEKSCPAKSIGPNTMD